MLLPVINKAPGAVPIGPYEMQIVESLAELRALEPEWRQLLADGGLGSNFFNDPLQVRLRLEREPRIRPWIIVLRRGGRIRCIAPIVLHETRLKIDFSVFTIAELPVRMLKVLGGEFVIAAATDATECFQVVFDYLASRQPEFGLVSLENLSVLTPLWKYCNSGSARDGRFKFFLASSQIDTTHQIHFPATYEEFLKTLSYETRRKLRRYTRRLQNTVTVRLERITEPYQVARFVDQLDQVYRDTWQAKASGYAPRNGPGTSSYLTEISRAGFLRSYVLSGDNRPIAFALGYQYDGIYYFMETGYSPEWADFGPGIVLMHLFFEDLFRFQKAEKLDFILGDQPYKRSFSNSQHKAAFVYLAPRNRWRLVLRVQQLLHFMSRQTLRAVSLLRLERAARRVMIGHP
jgi:CelD/BcsL family acetyltransferase involved in cellulose biosynthesis